MTVSTTHSYDQFLPDGIQTVFAFTFHCGDESWIYGLLDNTPIGGFTVLLNADQSSNPGGTVTFGAAPIGADLIIGRATALTQQTVYNPYGRFPAKSHEAALDQLTQATQDFSEIAGRTAQYPIGTDPGLQVQEWPVYEADKVWAWHPTLSGVVVNIPSPTAAIAAAAASAAAALVSENNALVSENNAAASYDSFDDRYLGPKAADPTLDNDGNALLTGALYWNTVSNHLRAWTGSAWVALTVNAAGLNAANIFTLDQSISNTSPALILVETGVTAQNGRWSLRASGEDLNLAATSDDGLSEVFAMTVQRTGAVIDSVSFPKEVQVNRGIRFPVTAPYISDPNVFDDYELGTWQPYFRFGGNNVGMIQNNVQGRYQKVGNMVNLNWYLDLSAKGSSTGPATIIGLPFAMASITSARVACTMYFQNISYTGTLLAKIQGGTSITLHQISEAGVLTDITDANFTNTSLIIGRTSYNTDD